MVKNVSHPYNLRVRVNTVTNTRTVISPVSERTPMVLRSAVKKTVKVFSDSEELAVKALVSLKNTPVSRHSYNLRPRN